MKDLFFVIMILGAIVFAFNATYRLGYKIGEDDQRVITELAIAKLDKCHKVLGAR